MFDAMRSNFYKKSKSFLKRSKTRVETAKKKSFSVDNHLKNDIAELLRNGHDDNAYGRVEGFLSEQNMSFCYEFIEQCITTIYNQLANMEKEKECPTECREAVASLMHAAARFAKLPELRELRTVFAERYGNSNSLEPYVSKEFLAKLSSVAPSEEKKIQIMQQIAQEYSIPWDSRSLRQQLFKLPPPAQDNPMHGTFHGKEKDGYSRHNRKDDDIPVRVSLNGRYKMSDERGHDVTTTQISKDVPYDRYNVPNSSHDEEASNYRRDSTSRDSQQTGSNSVGSFSEGEVDSKKPFHYGLIRPPYVKQNNAKGGSNIEEPMKSNDHVNAEHYKDPPVAKTNLKPPPGREISGNGMKAHKISPHLQSLLDGGVSDEEEKKMDQLLMHYSKKKTYPPLGKETDDSYGASGHRHARAIQYPPPGQDGDDSYGASGHRHARANQYPPPGQDGDDSYGASRHRHARANQYPPPGQDGDDDSYEATRHRNAKTNHYPLPGQENDDNYGAARHRSSRAHQHRTPGHEIDDTYGAARHRSSRGNAYPSPGQQYEETGVARHRNAKSEVPVAPARASSLPPEQTAKYEAPKKHVRANSEQPEVLAGHVHPKLPDYEDVAALLAALRGR